MKTEITFTQEEQENLKSLSMEYSTLYTKMGQNTINRRIVKLQLEKQLEELEKENETLITNFSELATKEEEIVKQLTDKYGVGNYNPETGVFTPEQ